MAYKAFFENPEDYNSKFDFHVLGGSPRLIKEFIQILKDNKDEILEINLSWYLFNNLILHNFLKKLSKEGIKVNIITIPLEGYDDNNPKKIKLKNGNYSDSTYTKYDLAKIIFKELFLAEDLPNYNIYFFPHLFVRTAHVKKFSRGRLPYSLHIKAGLIKKKKGSIVILSSSNMAVRDLVKYETLLVIEDVKQYQKDFEMFFSNHVKNSIHIKKFSSKLNTASLAYPYEKNISNNNIFFTSPLYFDSSNLLEEELNKLILSAKNRIVVCAQHLAAFDYEFKAQFHSTRNLNEQRIGILGTILEMARKGVGVTCLSQTFAPPLSGTEKYKNNKFRAPINTSNFTKFFSEFEKLNNNNNNYLVNPNIHSKFIIIDQKLIFCTYNFTPTQFTYLDSVDIKHFVNMPNLSYKGIHCEIGVHVVIEDEEIIKSFESHISAIKKAGETIKVI